MIYLQRCCCCVDLRLGTIVVAGLHIALDFLHGLITTIFGETGFPDVCHRLFIIFTMIHMLTCVVLLIGCLRLRSTWMIFYILVTIIQILGLLIMLAADVILRIFVLVVVINALMIPIFIYLWLVAYSFYAALGGPLFI
ncbi:hypothetical protein KR032_007671 [Drosophila birchii]|nr:hypothetical protein KR032_007671 [Drosophila birchii]